MFGSGVADVCCECSLLGRGQAWVQHCTLRVPFHLLGCFWHLGKANISSTPWLAGGVVRAHINFAWGWGLEQAGGYLGSSCSWGTDVCFSRTWLWPSGTWDVPCFHSYWNRPHKMFGNRQAGRSTRFWLPVPLNHVYSWQYCSFLSEGEAKGQRSGVSSI